MKNLENTHKPTSLSSSLSPSFSRSIFFACAIGLSAAGNAVIAHADEVLPEQSFKDGWVEGKVETIFLLNPHLNNFKIDSEVYGNRLVLTGEVNEDIDRELAEAIARGMDGITHVDNRIEVLPEKKPNKTEPTELTLSQRIQDVTTSTVIKGKYLKSPHIAGFDINVDTVNGKVTLEGEVESSAAKDLAWRLAKNTQGVVDVDNKLTVKAGDEGAKTKDIKKDKKS